MRNLFECSLTILLIIASCGGGNKEASGNSNEILTTLYDTLALSPLQAFPPLPEGYTLEDSLQTLRTFTKIKEEQSGKIQTIAIPAYLTSGKNLDVKDLKIENDFKKLVLQLKSLEAQPLDLAEIKTNRNDSIIEFNENLLGSQVSDFLKFDLLISFSRIAFNESGNKAVVIGIRSTSGLAGHSALYFFERKNGKWKTIKSLGLWIS